MAMVEWRWDLVFSLFAVCFALVAFFLTVMLRSCNRWAIEKPKPKSAMAMEKTNISSSSSFPSSFPWDLLHVNLQETILSLLPISALIRCTAVSRSLRSVIRSRSFLSSYPNYQNYPRPQFLFFDESTIADAYDPVVDRWTSFQLPSDSTRIDFCNDHFLVVHGHDRFFVYNILSGEVTQITPDLSGGYPFQSPVVLIPETPHDLHNFNLLMASVSREEGPLCSQVYNSNTGEWTMKGVLEEGFYALQCGLVCNGLVYCLGRNPDLLLKLDPVGGDWEIVDVELPAFYGSLFIKAFDGRLFFVGILRCRITIWEMDWERTEWRVHCFMPDDVFVEFFHGHGYGRDYDFDFDLAVLRGMFCFVASRSESCRCASILMYDLPERRWWWPSACERRILGLGNHSVHAVDPCVDLLKASLWLGGGKW